MVPPPADATVGNNASGPMPDAYETKKDSESDERAKEYEKKLALYSQAGLGVNYAKTYLINNLFYNRKMEFSGRLRFDICPGSTIGIEVVEDPFSELKSNVLYGLVEGVTIQFGVGDGNPSALTSFRLSSLRTEKEQGLFSVGQHPMYVSKNSFIGAPLSQEVAS
jgi:hypothetical protein